MKRTDVDKEIENLYKAFEMFPGAKMAVEMGEKAAREILEIINYLTNLTMPRNLSFLGVNKTIRLMDTTTAIRIRDDQVRCNIKKIGDLGVVEQYGKRLLEGGAKEALIASGSEIALIQEDDSGRKIITTKKQMGLENKHDMDLIRKFHRMEDDESQSAEYTENDVKLLEEDHEIKAMKLGIKRSRENKDLEEEDEPPWT